MLWLEDVTFTVDFQPYGTYNIKPCTKADFDFLVSAIADTVKSKSVIKGVELLLGELPCKTPIMSACRVFLFNYVTAIQQYCKDNFEKFSIPEHLDLPDANMDEDEEKKEPLRYPLYTYEEYLVREYTGYNFREIQALDILTYRFYAAEAYKISVLKRVDGTGTAYLNECFDYMQEMKNFNIDDLL